MAKVLMVSARLRVFWTLLIEMINKIVYNFSMFENECSPVCLLFDFLQYCAV